jgi:hypothetical protein
MPGLSLLVRTVISVSSSFSGILVHWFAVGIDEGSVSSCMTVPGHARLIYDSAE